MIQINNLNFSYGLKHTLNSINLNFDGSQIISLVGPNGCGKSTLLKCMCRILATPNNSIIIDGLPLHTYSRHDLAKLIAYVPQHPSLNMSISVIDAIKIGRTPYMNFRLSKKDENIVFEVIEKMDLEHMAFTSLHELSGGERQRVLLARVIAQQSKILFLDEPTSALDLRNQLETAELLRNIQQEQELTVIVAIHDLNLAGRFSDTVVQMSNGTVYSHGAWKETITEESIMDVYGVHSHISHVQGVPYIVSLKASEYGITHQELLLKPKRLQS